ncbi:hypothetical protein ACGY2W_31230, partial [Burkholderia pseudomallei]
MQRTSSSSWASNVARVVMWRDPRAGGKRKVTVRDELAGDGAGRGRSRVRLRGRPRDGARMRRTPVRQTLQRWRPNAVRKFAAVRAGTASAAYAANAGVPSVEAVADEMPFASSQRFAHERHLPMAPAARRCGSPGAAPLADASHRAASRDSPPSLCRAVPAPRAARRTRSRRRATPAARRQAASVRWGRTPGMALIAPVESAGP